ncbi:MAG: YggU family protein [Ardenticatenia bacterium]|nr:MAG: YggU family protein [Ardenticatenia bacterium]
MDLPFARSDGDSVLLTVHVQPRAARTQVAGLHGDALKIRLNAPPVDGRANDALCAFLAEMFGVPRRAVEIVQGETARRKIVRIEGVTLQDVSNRLA